jgi:hypothetical protein
MSQQIIECAYCSKKNRVPDDCDIPDGKKLICGACKSDLIHDDEDDDLDDDDNTDEDDDQ